MALFLEDSQKVTRRKAPVPLKDRQYYSAWYNALEKIMPKNNLKNLKSLASTKNYNKKGDDKLNGKEQNTSYVSVEDAKKRMQRMNPNDITQGGQKAYNFYKKTVERARSQAEVSPIEPQKPTANVKPSDVKITKQSTPTAKIKTENRKIFESEYYDDRPKYYDYLEDYDAYYVLSEFFYEKKPKQDWGVLINPSMYERALKEFSRFGRLTNSTFPSKYVYQWMGIIMKNTAILRANTDLVGHSMSFPIDEISDFAERVDGISIEDDDSAYEWLEEKGLYDWMTMPDGSDAWSDYGLEPLEKIFIEYNENLPPEKVLVLVNRALDVYHQRGDMASIFIQGGSKALSKIAECAKANNKKVYITEEQLIKLNDGKHNR